MRIVIHREELNAWQSVTIGWANALSFQGNQVALWSPQEKSAHDLWYEFNPEIIICSTEHLTRPLMKCLLESKTKICLRLRDWGELANKINVTPLATEEEKNAVHLLKTNNRINFGFSHYLDEFLTPMVGDWLQLVRLVSSPLAADTLKYTPGPIDPEFACDVAFVGGHWPYKSKYLNWLVKLRNDLPNLHMKVYGYGNWPLLETVGPISSENEVKLLRSAKVVPNLMEPFAVEYGCDLNERSFKTFACNTISITHNTKSVNSIFKKIDTFNNYEEFKKLIEKYIEQKHTNKEMLELVTEKHNYINRTTKLIAECYN